MKKTTLRARFIPKLLLLLLPLVVFINLYHFKISHLLREQAASLGREFSSIYIREIDTALTDIRSWLIGLSEDTIHLKELSSSDPEIQCQQQRYYSRVLQEAVDRYPILDTAFIVSTEYPSPIIKSSRNVTFEEHQAFAEAAKNIALYRRPFNTKWIAMAIPNEKEYYFCTVIVLEDTVLGAVVKPQTLLTSLAFPKDSEKKFALAKHSGGVIMTNFKELYDHKIDLAGDLSNYYITGRHQSFIVSGSKSSVGPFRLMMIASSEEVQSSISWMKGVSLVFLALSIIMLGGVIISFRKDVLKPLANMDKVIEEIGQSKFDKHFVTQNEAQEFSSIYNIFNRMIDQIQTLRIENYKQLIHKQQTELRFYQTQIKPHFMLNCLTTIQNLAKQGKTDELSKFISNFSSFARYMFRTDFTLVSLRDELEQVKHFISMQELRYLDQIFFVSDIDNALIDYQIPAMLVQTLVENSIKHGMDEKTGISIFVQCKKVIKEGKAAVQISVEDNGCGFSPEVLAAINDFKGDQSVLGFGLQNVSTVLKLIYGDAAAIHLENVNGSGAGVIITLFS